MGFRLRKNQSEVVIRSETNRALKSTLEAKRGRGYQDLPFESGAQTGPESHDAQKLPRWLFALPGPLRGPRSQRPPGRKPPETSPTPLRTHGTYAGAGRMLCALAGPANPQIAFAARVRERGEAYPKKSPNWKSKIIYKDLYYCL